MADDMTMEDDPDQPRDGTRAGTPANAPAKSAGGIFIALGSIVGAIIGGFLGQPSFGFLAGLALGGVVAIGIWLLNR